MPRAAPKTASPADTPGTRIRAAREARGLSQAALGALAGVTQQYLQSIEVGRQPLSIGKLCMLAKVLGVNPREIDPETSSVLIPLPIAGTATLLRDAGDPETWTLDYSDGHKTQVLHDLAVGSVLRDLVSRGIQVTAPPVPPLE